MGGDEPSEVEGGASSIPAGGAWHEVAPASPGEGGASPSEGAASRARRPAEKRTEGGELGAEGGPQAGAGQLRSAGDPSGAEPAGLCESGPEERKPERKRKRKRKRKAARWVSGARARLHGGSEAAALGRARHCYPHFGKARARAHEHARTDTRRRRLPDLALAARLWVSRALRTPLPAPRPAGG